MQLAARTTVGLQVAGLEPHEALAVLSSLRSTLESCVQITPPTSMLLSLPRESIGMVLREVILLQAGAGHAALKLRCVSSFFKAGEGFVILQEECAKIFPRIATFLQGENLLNLTLQLLHFEEQRAIGVDVTLTSTIHKAMAVCPFAVVALVSREPEVAHGVLSPCSFRVA